MTRRSARVGADRGFGLVRLAWSRIDQQERRHVARRGLASPGRKSGTGDICPCVAVGFVGNKQFVAALRAACHSGHGESPLGVAGATNVAADRRQFAFRRCKQCTIARPRIQPSKRHSRIAFRCTGTAARTIRTIRQTLTQSVCRVSKPRFAWRAQRSRQAAAKVEAFRIVLAQALRHRDADVRAMLPTGL